MKGIQVETAGALFTLVEGIAKPSPSADQILVKSIATVINTVTVLLVTAWPIILGCDVAGVVVEVGKFASSSFKVGGEICGCTRLGVPGHSTFQDYFVMEAHLTKSQPKNMFMLQAAAIGVGTLTASFGLFTGQKLPLNDLTAPPNETDE
ncbi:hypothetical protein MMC16_007516 [Acarospora aff. strigata]|nr:hypothetical protein [Acarospora aff. strigata]